MRALPVPVDSIATILNKCLDGVNDEELVTSYRKTFHYFELVGMEYCKKAVVNEFHLIDTFIEDEKIILDNDLTKDKIKNLYTGFFSKINKPAREIYDKIKISAPHNLCPYCGCGTVGTLDHFLPKSKYPFLSVLAENLVPSCWACNHGKSNTLGTTAGQQTLHPYYDHRLLVNEQWLFASVIQKQPAMLMFHVKVPLNWDIVDKERVETHFSSYEIANSCANLASAELADMYFIDKWAFQEHGCDFLKKSLDEKAKSFALSHKNYWRTAMYQALATNDWYCTGHFINDD